MNENHTTVEIITALGRVTCTALGIIAATVYLCGPQILPWYKK